MKVSVKQQWLCRVCKHLRDIVVSNRSFFSSQINQIVKQKFLPYQILIKEEKNYFYESKFLPNNPTRKCYPIRAFLEIS